VKEWLKVLTIEQITSDRSNFSTAERVHHLEILITALERKLKKIQRLHELANLYKPCNIGIVVQKCLGAGLADVYYEYVSSVAIKDADSESALIESFNALASKKLTK